MARKKGSSIRKGFPKNGTRQTVARIRAGQAQVKTLPTVTFFLPKSKRAVVRLIACASQENLDVSIEGGAEYN